MAKFFFRFIPLLSLLAGFGFAGPATAAEQAGRVAVATGQVTDTALDGTTRSLQDGDAIYAGDRFATGDDSYADLDFEDGGRILLRPDTQFQISTYHYDAAAHEQQGLDAKPAVQVSGENALFRLLKGGLSAISGLIGHANHESYAMQTPVATIGIRGTEYEVRYCADDCKDKGNKDAPITGGAYIAEDEGIISVKNQAGEIQQSAGKFSYVKDGRTPLQFLASRPAALADMELPDKYKDRMEKMRKKILEERRRLREELRRRLRHHHPGS